MPTAKVIDLSHHNSPIGPQFDFVKARADGCLGVICKASEGATFRDGSYQSMRASATAAGLLWGAYHFGTAAKPIDQVSNFYAAHPTLVKTIAVSIRTNKNVVDVRSRKRNEGR